jgi:hypothetical protein
MRNAECGMRNDLNTKEYELKPSGALSRKKEVVGFKKMLDKFGIVYTNDSSFMTH